MVTYYDFIAVPPGGEWLPTDIGGCPLWLRSDFAWQDAAKTVPCTDESLIWTGEDKSGEGNDVIQATEAARPVYYANGNPAIINGHPYWYFDGIDDYLANNSPLNLPGVNCTLFMIFKQYSTGNWFNHILWNQGGLGRVLYNNAGTNRNHFGIIDVGGAAETSSPAVFHTMIGTHENLVEQKIYYNNSLEGTRGDTTDRTFAPNNLLIGVSQDLLTFVADAFVEIAIYDHVISEASRTLLDDYVTARYQI